MRILFTAIMSIAVAFSGFCQNTGIAKMLENDLRNWIPIGVKEQVIRDNLDQSRKIYDVSDEKMTLKGCRSKSIDVDRTITVMIKTGSVFKGQGVLYLCSQGYCISIVYLDMFENLSKWQPILQSSERVDDNHFILGNLYHYIIRLSPKDGIINIQIE